MPGPFPGVDPYLEARGYWPDFHLKFLNYLQEAIADRLPDDYEARLEVCVRLANREAGSSVPVRPDRSDSAREEIPPMPGPFPGIDPYLEAQGYWPDFHMTFLTYWREAIADHLPDDYEARLEERVKLVDLEVGTSFQIRPDVAVVQSAPRHQQGAAGGAAVLDPETIPTVILDEDREVFLKILHRPDRKLVTVLELLSPANKAEPDRRDYLTRRNAVLRQAVHLVELDVLTAGHRLPMQRPLPPGDCYAIVARWEQRPDCQVYAWSIRHRLPLLPVPLRAPDPDIVIDLAAVYATTFDRGRYARSIDYAAALELPLNADDRSWAEHLARTGRA